MSCALMIGGNGDSPPALPRLSRNPDACLRSAESPEKRVSVSYGLSVRLLPSPFPLVSELRPSDCDPKHWRFVFSLRFVENSSCAGRARRSAVPHSLTDFHIFILKALPIPGEMFSALILLRLYPASFFAWIRLNRESTRSACLQTLCLVLCLRILDSLLTDATVMGTPQAVKGCAETFELRRSCSN